MVFINSKIMIFTKMVTCQAFQNMKVKAKAKILL